MARGIVIREQHYPGRAPVDAYGNGGFRFADMSHRGSILCLPSGIHGWAATEEDPLTVNLFERAIAEAADIEVLLVGTGTTLRPLPRESRRGVEDVLPAFFSCENSGDSFSRRRM